MRKGRLFVIVALSVVSLVSIAAAASNFTTHLTGDQERPVMRVTGAQGQAIVELSPDGTALNYKLNVANIDNVIMAHIHLGAADATGPVVVWLYGAGTPPTAPLPPGGGPVNGRIAAGTITAANLTGLLAGHPLSDLVTEIENGNAYVNVHTNDGVGETNTGPGDFPGGEIRGQFHDH